MLHSLKKMIPFVLVAFLSVSCAESNTRSEEETEITTIDSTTNNAKETNDKLEEQTKKVESSLEKLDSEFTTTN